jgi:hypothetical protein
MKLHLLVLVLCLLLVASAVVDAKKPKKNKNKKVEPPKVEKPKPSPKSGFHWPRVDTKLMRSSPNVVIVPKGDPRARGGNVLTVHSNPVYQAGVNPLYKDTGASGTNPLYSVNSNPIYKGNSVGVPSVSPLQFNGIPDLKASKAPHIPKSPTVGTDPAAPKTPASSVIVSGVAPPAASSYGCLSSFNPGLFALRAQEYQQSYRANGVRYDDTGKTRQFGPSLPVMSADCSSFVTSVLTSLKWNCLFAATPYTSAMRVIMEHRGGFHPAPRLGDIVVWSSHVGIVAEVCGVNSVRMVAMGTHGAADTGCIALDRVAGWGSGQFLGYWTPN